ncbi:MAG: hypothetical protein D6707_01880, partial [Bacteroidetes bacterium]
MKAKKVNIAKWLWAIALTINTTAIAWAETPEVTETQSAFNDKDLVLWTLSGALLIQLIIIYMLTNASSLLLKISKDKTPVLIGAFLLTSVQVFGANENNSYMWDYESLYTLLIIANIFLLLIN